MAAAALMIKAAHIANAKRYVMVSAMSADANREGEEVFDVYIRAKGRADDELAESGLEYTIVRPGGLTDDEPKGRVEIALVRSSVARSRAPTSPRSSPHASLTRRRSVRRSSSSQERTRSSWPSRASATERPPLREVVRRDRRTAGLIEPLVEVVLEQGQVVAGEVRDLEHEIDDVLGRDVVVLEAPLTSSRANSKNFCVPTIWR